MDLTNNHHKIERKKSHTLDIGSLMYGKVPPQARDLEEAILGAIMLEKSAFFVAREILQPECFYLEAHQRIFKAMASLEARSAPIDMLTVVEELRNNEELDLVGGAYYITRLTNGVVSAANIEMHSRIVFQKFLSRLVIEKSSNLINEAYSNSTDSFELVQGMMETNDLLTTKYLPKDVPYDTVVLKTLKNVLDKDPNKQFGQRTGFPSIDRIIDFFIDGLFYVVGARPGAGKCLGENTKVVMYDGTLKFVQDIRPGDVLMGPDSTPRNVLSTCTGKENMYWVHQKKGISYRVNESHILSLKRSRTEFHQLGSIKNGGKIKFKDTLKYKNGDVLNISVSDWLKTSPKFKTNYKGYKTSIEFKEKPVNIDPYFLGLWLGDGTSDSVAITTMDPEVVEYIYWFGNKCELDVKKEQTKNKSFTYSICNSRCRNKIKSENITYHSSAENPQTRYMKQNKLYWTNIRFSIREVFKDYGLINNKHIPQAYISNSIKVRLELLAGLIDSDGYYHKEQGFEITQKNKKLAYEIKFLCDSLGFKTSIAKKKATIKKISFECDVYRVHISGALHTIPTRIARKQARVSCCNRNSMVTAIEVQFDKFDDYYGFVLDGDSLFCLEDFTVTHNTAFMVQLVENLTKQHYILTPTGKVLIKPKPVGIIELETHDEAFVHRQLANISRVNSRKMKTGDLTEGEKENIHAAANELISKGIISDFNPTSTITQVRIKAKAWKQKHDIGILLIDYLQYMDVEDYRMPRERQVALMSKGLAALAKELSIPVIAFAQLSREVYKRADKRPQMSDLRESGSIESDARCIMFLHRPEYYGELVDGETGLSLVGITEVIVAKNNDGDTGVAKLKFIKELSRFEELGTEVSAPFLPLYVIPGTKDAPNFDDEVPF